MKGDYLSNVRLIQIQICSAFKEKPTPYLFSYFYLFDIKVRMEICWHLSLPFRTCTATPLMLKLTCYTLLGPVYVCFEFIHSVIHSFMLHVCWWFVWYNHSHSHLRAIYSSQFIHFKIYFVCVFVCVWKKKQNMDQSKKNSLMFCKVVSASHYLSDVNSLVRKIASSCPESSCSI